MYIELFYLDIFYHNIHIKKILLPLFFYQRRLEIYFLLFSFNFDGAKPPALKHLSRFPPKVDLGSTSTRV